MSSIYNDIRAILDVNLSSIVGLPTIVWENKSYEPTDNEYISQFMVDIATSIASLGDNGLDLNTGIYQININAKVDTSAKRINELCDLVVDGFRPRKPLTLNGIDLRITNVNRNPQEINGSYAIIAVDIEFETYTQQRT